MADSAIDPDTKTPLQIMKPILANMLGPVGQNTNFILLPSKSEDGRPVADANREGTLHVMLSGRLSIPSAFGQSLTGATGLTVFKGHWAQTLDRQRKQAFVHDLFEPPGAVDVSAVRRVLIRNRVRYILLDSRSALDYGLGDGTRLFDDFGRLARVAWQRPQVMIWEVTSEPATGEHQPPIEPQLWTSGDWRGP